MKSYLHKRPGSGYWQIRLPVPSKLQQTLRKKEITRSTGTSDLKQAEEISRRFIAEKRDQFDSLIADVNDLPTFDINAHMVEAFFTNFCDRQRESRSRSAGDQAGYDMWISSRKRERAEFVRLANLPDYSRIEKSVVRVLRGRGFTLPSSSSGREDLLKKCMQAILDGLDVVIREAEGELDARPSSGFVTSQIESDDAKFGEHLSDYLNQYLDELALVGKQKRSAIQQAKTVALLFIEWVGDRTAVSSLSKKEAAAFRQLLRQFPANRGKTKKFSKASIEECVRIAKRDGDPTLSLATMNRYINQLSAFFRFMYKQGSCKENIWRDMGFDVDRTANKRPSFSNAQLNQILSSPLYAGFKTHGKEHEPGDVKANDWRYWVPILCLFTGARVTEVAQLHVDDIEDVGQNLVGRLRANSERGQTLKNKASSRLVVFHPKLLEAGFRSYWLGQLKRSETDGNSQLFPNLRAGKRPELGARPARWWRDYLKRVGVKNGADGLGVHSFRHRMADEMRAAGYTNSEFGYLILGHSDGSVTADYGETPQGTVDRLAEMISKAEFEGVDFSNILQNCRKTQV
jgi:integrase